MYWYLHPVYYINGSKTVILTPLHRWKIWRAFSVPRSLPYKAEGNDVYIPPFTSTHAPLLPFTPIKCCFSRNVKLFVHRLYIFNLEYTVEVSLFLHNVITFSIGYHSWKLRALQVCTCLPLKPSAVFMSPLESNYSWSFNIGHLAILSDWYWRRQQDSWNILTEARHSWEYISICIIFWIRLSIYQNPYFFVPDLVFGWWLSVE